MAANSSSPRLPVFALLLAATMWGVIWYPLRQLEQQGLSGLWTTLVMYAAAMVVGLFLAGGRLRQIAQAPWLLVGIAIANGWTNVAFILAVIEGNVVRVLLLFYLSPLWTVAMGWLLLGEHITRLSAFTLALAMGGATFMLWDPQLGLPWPRGHADWLALSSGLAFALANVLVRKAQGVDVRIKAMATWVGVTLTAAMLILASDSPLPEVPLEVINAAIALGLGGILVMTVAVQYGVTHMPVHRSAVILLFELVAGAVSAQLLTDEVVILREWLGGSMIVLAAYISARIEGLGGGVGRTQAVED